MAEFTAGDAVRVFTSPTMRDMELSGVHVSGVAATIVHETDEGDYLVEFDQPTTLSPFVPADRLASVKGG